MQDKKHHLNVKKQNANVIKFEYCESKINKNKSNIYSSFINLHGALSLHLFIET